ncbi:MAG: hypothetical protein ACTSUE_17805 [Promethearchaeota archaeon]
MPGIKESRDLGDEILKCVRDAEWGIITVTTIVEKTKISRPSVYKYLRKFRDEGLVIEGNVDKLKVYRYNEEKSRSHLDVLYSMVLGALGKFVEKDKQVMAMFMTWLNSLSIKRISDFVFPDRYKEMGFLDRGKSLLELYNIARIVKDLILDLTPLGTKAHVKIDKPSEDDLNAKPSATGAPMKIQFSVIDDGYISRGARFHYYLVGKVIEKNVCEWSKKKLYFHLIPDPDEVAKMPDRRRAGKELKDTSTAVYYELGYEETYFHDFWIESTTLQGDDASEQLLRRIAEFYVTLTGCKAKLSIKHGFKHCVLRFPSRRSIEEVYEFATFANRRNKELVQFLQERDEQGKNRLLRRWSNPADYKGEEFAVIRLDTNLQTTMQDHVDASHDTYRYTGVSAHWEKVRGGWRIFCKDELDFDVLFVPMKDDERRLEIYKRLATDPHEFMKLRKSELWKAMMKFSQLKKK